MNTDIIKVLEKSGIKATPMRMLVLEQLMVQPKNVTLSELEELLYPSDRITLYRTLQTFVKHGLVHAIETTGNGTTYALCRDECKEEAHKDQHPHFMCEQCKKVICTSAFSYTIEPKQGSDEFKLEKVEVMLRGICPDCRKG